MNRGTPAHEPTEERRKQVACMVSYGIPQYEICKVLGITDKTLTKYYREELDTALAKANTKVADMLFTKCMQGDGRMIEFWLKTRAKWKTTHLNELQNLDRDGNPIDPPSLVVNFKGNEPE